MALKANILGMVYKYPEVFVVGREQVKQFAKSVKSEDPASIDEAAAAARNLAVMIAARGATG